ncbi:MAG: nucleotidyltransferase domain-containing protein [Pseudomonadota bacterium]
MASVVSRLDKLKLINPPAWLPANTMFEGWTGSVAYGASDDSSDMDVVGFCLPPKEMTFPHLAGEIAGFGRQVQRFEQFQQHHVHDAGTGREYDITIFSIVKFFQLTMENNPNMVDNLYLPRRCVLHSTPIYEHVRTHRALFLHKGSFHKFRGYAMAQMSKIDRGAQRANPKRQASIDAHGFDVKFAYHLVRLLLELEQILATGDLRLDRDAEVYKSIRRGEWSLERIKAWAEEKERALETLHAASSLPERPDEEAIKRVLIECLEMHYGSLEGAVVEQDKHARLVRELQELVRRHS